MDLIAAHYAVDAFARLSRVLSANNQFSQKLLHDHCQKRFHGVLVCLELTLASAALETQNNPPGGSWGAARVCQRGLHRGPPGTHSGEKAKAEPFFRSHVYGRVRQRCLGCPFQEATVTQCVALGLGGSRLACQRTRVPSFFAPLGNHSRKIVGVLKGCFLNAVGRFRSRSHPGELDIRKTPRN